MICYLTIFYSSFVTFVCDIFIGFSVGLLPWILVFNNQVN